MLSRGNRNSDRDFCGRILSDPLDPAQKAARSCSMDIDIIGAAIREGTFQQPLGISAVAHVAQIVDAHVVGIVDPHRDQSMTDDLRCGAPWTRPGSYSMFWSNADVTSTRPSGCCASC